MKQLFCYRCNENTVHLATSLAFFRVRGHRDDQGREHWDRGGPAWVCAQCGEVIMALPAEQGEWLRAWFSDPPGVDSWGKLKEPMPRLREPEPWEDCVRCHAVKSVDPMTNQCLKCLRRDPNMKATGNP